MDPVLLATARTVDPVRVALIETLDADPPAPGGFLVMGVLALALLDGTARRGSVVLTLTLALDVFSLLRIRRAHASAADRAREFGMRKSAYLDLRRRLLSIVLRLKRGEHRHWEP